MYTSQLRDEVSQGDIFDAIPIAYVSSEQGYANLLAQVRSVRAILLSHDCEYDKPTSHFVIVVEIRSLSEVHPNSQGNIRDYKTRHTFYLQELPDTIPESYVDFRRIERVRKAVIAEGARAGRRIASLTDEARLALQRQIAIFFGYGR